MKSLSNSRLFGIAVLVGILLVLGMGGYERWGRRPVVVTRTLGGEISVAEQILRDDIPRLKASGFAAIIDLRPDGEADDQPDSKAIESVVVGNRMDFAYVPVPHGEIPDSAVQALSSALSSLPRPVLLYCRSGRRAVRTWSLVEASRAGGQNAEAIQSAAKGAGQSIDDLLPLIAQRIALRPKT